MKPCRWCSRLCPSSRTYCSRICQQKDDYSRVVAKRHADGFRIRRMKREEAEGNGN